VSRINKIKESADKVNSIFMKNDPIVRRYAELEDDGDLADHMDALFYSAWVDTDGQLVVKSMLQEAMVTGMSVCKTYWNPLDVSRHKTGQIAIEHCKRGSVLFDPKSSNMHRLRDARYIIHHTKPPIGWFLAKWGSEAEIALGLRDSQGRPRSGIPRMVWMSAKEVMKGIKNKVMGDEEEIEETVDVYEFWIFPKTMYASELVGGEELSVGDFPYGLVVTMAKNHILRRKGRDWMPNPFVTRKQVESVDQYGFPAKRRVEVGHKRSPFSVLYWSRTEDRQGKGNFGVYDCMGAVEGAISLQHNINALRRNAAINARTIANPGVVYNPDLLENPPDTLTWNPGGQLIETKGNVLPEQAMHLLQGQNMPQDIFQIIYSDITEVEKAFGLEPGVVGLFPPPGGGTSHTPALTVGALQESAFGPLWTYVFELGYTLLDLSILYDGLIQQKYKAERYSTVSRNGQQRFVEWTDRHISAQFRRKVLAGATTTLYDIDKATRLTNYEATATQAIMSQNPAIMKVAVAKLTALNDPAVYQFVQILGQEIAKLEQAQMELMQMGAGNMMEQAQGQQMLPQGG